MQSLFKIQCEDRQETQLSLAELRDEDPQASLQHQAAVNHLTRL